MSVFYELGTIVCPVCNMCDIVIIPLKRRAFLELKIQHRNKYDRFHLLHDEAAMTSFSLSQKSQQLNSQIGLPSPIFFTGAARRHDGKERKAKYSSTSNTSSLDAIGGGQQTHTRIYTHDRISQS